MIDERREVAVAEWVAVATDARDSGFGYFDWLSAVDRTSDDPAGFDVVLHLLDITTARALRGLLISARLPTGAHLPSVTGVFAGAAWHERETHEMFGIEITGFDDGTGLGLRPLLLPDGFEGHPLRKDFYLTARVSKDWPGAKEPGAPHTGGPARRKMQPPGIPPPEWGPRWEH
ncbi:NADH-quinone oxidoreductase subunit C [Nostocoides sp.]|uniref:NADH-quinone oxidoreductase subunit C n=1 Tax=Nostocoides sp. TaxID=1917966 RepID=UPI002C714EA6|nr:NADH-quinone oxidoreductase subunit C [Tetrasphaera sp.]